MGCRRTVVGCSLIVFSVLTAARVEALTIWPYDPLPLGTTTETSEFGPAQWLEFFGFDPGLPFPEELYEAEVSGLEEGAYAAPKNQRSTSIASPTGTAWSQSTSSDSRAVSSA
jgi:hypothetical protein